MSFYVEISAFFGLATVLATLQKKLGKFFLNLLVAILISYAAL
jgi:hypothetical protein